MKHLSKVILCLLATLFLVTGCSTFFKRTPAQLAELPKHYVMTLHGVRGNENSYGDFHSLIKTHLDKIDPSFETIPLNFVYKTAQFDYSPHKAAIEINQKLDAAIPKLNPNDKISVVAYSMGGQVAVAWYYDSLKDPAHAKYPRQTANVVSLGAAYWGAQEAALFTNDIGTMKRTIKGVIIETNKIFQDIAATRIGARTARLLADIQDTTNTKLIFPQIDNLKTMDQVKNFYDKKTIKSLYSNDWAGGLLDQNEILKNLRNSALRDIAKISFAELQALSIAGTTATELRTSMMAAPKDLPTKWTSISTLVQCFEGDTGADEVGCNDFQNQSFDQLNKQLVKFNFGYVRRETDNAVITPSSVAQFYYAYDTNKNYTEGELTPASDFRFSINPENHKAIFAETLHATLITTDIYERAFNALGKLGKSWSRLADDVVIVHANKCATPDNCDHPVYKYIIDELSDCDQAGEKCDDSQYNILVGQFQNRKSKEPSIQSVQNTLKSELHGFTLELNLRLPPGYDTSKITESNIFQSVVKADFDVFSDEDRVLKITNAPYKIHLGRKLELGSILIKTAKFSDQTHFKVNFTGLITTDNKADYKFADLQSGLPVNFTVSLPGLKSRRVEAKVSPYHSTFVDLTMAK